MPILEVKKHVVMPILELPIRHARPPGPGSGIGGEPGAPGENCNPLGNVLIIQEPGAACPDDNVDGGMIIFDWAETPATVVDEIALLDVDYETKLTILYMTPNGNMSVKTIVVPQLGDNSYQVVKIDTPNVKQIVLMAARSVGVASLSFCYEKPPIVPTSGSGSDSWRRDADVASCGHEHVHVHVKAAMM